MYSQITGTSCFILTAGNDNLLTHWGRVTHICVSKPTIIGSDNGLSPGRRQAIIWTNDGILLIRTLGTNFSEILGKLHSISFKKMHLKMSSAKGRLFSLGLNELSHADIASGWNEYGTISNKTIVLLVKLNLIHITEKDVYFISISNAVLDWKKWCFLHSGPRVLGPNVLAIT